MQCIIWTNTFHILDKYTLTMGGCWKGWRLDEGWIVAQSRTNAAPDCTSKPFLFQIVLAFIVIVIYLFWRVIFCYKTRSTNWGHDGGQICPLQFQFVVFKLDLMILILISFLVVFRLKYQFYLNRIGLFLDWYLMSWRPLLAHNLLLFCHIFSTFHYPQIVRVRFNISDKRMMVFLKPRIWFNPLHCLWKYIYLQTLMIPYALDMIQRP